MTATAAPCEDARVRLRSRQRGSEYVVSANVERVSVDRRTGEREIGSVRRVAVAAGADTWEALTPDGALIAHAATRDEAVELVLLDARLALARAKRDAGRRLADEGTAELHDAFDEVLATRILPVDDFARRAGVTKQALYAAAKRRGQA